jgi:hypothetical protein
MVAFVAGLLITIFGFYLYLFKEGFASIVGSLFTILGFTTLIYGLIVVLVPTFF